MSRAETKPLRRERVGIAAVVALLHVAAAIVLIHAFAPDLAAAIIKPAMQAFDVPLAPEPVPEHEQAPKARHPAPRAQGGAAASGRKGDPRAVSAPPVRMVLTPTIAPPVSGAGEANASGAAISGSGAGAGGAGQGLGAGATGSGTGGGGGASAKAVKIAGDIVSARDYPQRTRDLRLGSAVTIALTVGIDGRVSACRIVRPSRDPDADRITCQLATERFRFRPARDASGHPAEAVYGWQQRWFTPGKG